MLHQNKTNTKATKNPDSARCFAPCPRRASPEQRQQEKTKTVYQSGGRINRKHSPKILAPQNRGNGLELQQQKHLLPHTNTYNPRISVLNSSRYVYYNTYLLCQRSQLREAQKAYNSKLSIVFLAQHDMLWHLSCSKKNVVFYRCTLCLICIFFCINTFQKIFAAKFPCILSHQTFEVFKHIRKA